MTEIELGPLDKADTITLATHITGVELDADRAAQIYRETEGQPLFVVEMIRAGDSHTARAKGTPLPPKVQGVIESRLAQLSAPARRLANLAATIGRAFDFDVLAEASKEDEDILVRGLDELWQRRIIREQRENDYDFSHDKIREVAYSSLGVANRRLLHRRVAVALETVYSARLDTASGQIARHYEQGGIIPQAVSYYWWAGTVAQQNYANEDAIQFYSKGLKLLETTPDTPERAEQELPIQLSLSIAYRITKGYTASEVEQALIRAQALCQQLGQTEQLGPVLWGLYSFRFVRAELRSAYKLGEELFRLAQELQPPGSLATGASCVGEYFDEFGRV